MLVLPVFVLACIIACCGSVQGRTLLDNPTSVTDGVTKEARKIEKRHIALGGIGIGVGVIGGAAAGYGDYYGGGYPGGYYSAYPEYYYPQYPTVYQQPYYPAAPYFGGGGGYEYYEHHYHGHHGEFY